MTFVFVLSTLDMNRMMRATHGNTAPTHPQVQLPPAHTLVVASVNTGHKDPTHYAHILQHLRAHVILLQELGQVTPTTAQAFQHLLPSYTLYHNATSATNGVGILVSTCLSHLTKHDPSSHDSHNRTISVTIDNITVTSCYGSRVSSHVHSSSPTSAHLPRR